MILYHTFGVRVNRQKPFRGTGSVSRVGWCINPATKSSLIRLHLCGFLLRLKSHLARVHIDLKWSDARSVCVHTSQRILIRG